MTLDGRQVLVAGGAGFIGRHLIQTVIRRYPQAAVTVIGRRPADQIELPDVVTYVRVEGSNLAGLDAAVGGNEIIFDLIGDPAVPDIQEDPARGFQSNVQSCYNILEAARRRGVARIVHVSTGRVFGAPAVVPVTEAAPIRPAEPYAAQKAAAELFCQAFSRSYGLPIVILRPFSVYGPGRSWRRGSLHGVIPRFVGQLLGGQPITIVGEGTQLTDFVHVQDVADALVAAATMEGIHNESFNIGSGTATSVTDLVRVLSEVTNSTPEIQYLEARKETISSYPSIGKAKRLLGYDTRVSLREGLEEYVRWARRLGDPPP